LAQSCGGIATVELGPQPRDRGKVAPFDKAVAVLDRCDPLAASFTLHPFVAIQDQLGTERWIAADPDGYVTPFTINQVKVEVPDIWPTLAMADLDDPALPIALDFPYWGWSVAFDDEKQSGKCRILGQIRLCQFVLAVARLRLNEGNALLGTESVEATRKGARHFSKMLVVES
jgi:hypothetical protein